MEQEFKTEQRELFSFDPIIIIRSVLKRWYWILVAALVVGMAAYVYSDSTYKPSYTTTTTFVASARSSTSTVYQNLSAATDLATVFTEVLNSSLLRDTILEELELTHFDGTIWAEAIPETNLLTLRVTASDSCTAFRVTQCIIQNHHIVSAQVLGDTVLEVLQNPTVPMAPSNARGSESFAKKAGLVAAAAVCVLLAVLAWSRDTVRSRREAQDKLDCRCLGEIRHERKYKTPGAFFKRQKRAILITNPATSFHYVESIRKLRNRVEGKLRDGRKVMLVTSVLENEGKSTVTVNLALSLALKGRRVLLIDCDLHKPDCSRLLGKTVRGAGTMDVITGQQELMDAVIRDKASGLYTLLETRSVTSATDLVGSEGMARLLEDARQHFDVILLDMPPMSAAPDAEAALDFADGVLLVIRQDAAFTKQINDAARALTGGGAELLGCVLNNVYGTSVFTSGYGYGYGYGYGHYGKYGKYGSYGHYGGYGKYSQYERFGMQGAQEPEQDTEQ